MPWDQVFRKFKKGQLHSGGPSGPMVSNPKQATAIALSEKSKAAGKPEYQSKHPVHMLKMPRKFGRANA